MNPDTAPISAENNTTPTAITPIGSPSFCGR